MSQRDKDSNGLIVNYLYLRKAIGCVGVLLPLVLLFGNLIFSSTVQESMSYYYYTHMRNIFVGTLCAQGVFLIGYAGYDEWDRWITNIAGICSIGVAFCPTKPAVCAAHARTCVAPSVRALSTGQNVIGYVHLGFAALTFLALAVMALRFTKTSGNPPPQPGFVNQIRWAMGYAPQDQDPRTSLKKRRDAIYRFCGIAILVLLVLAVLSNLLPRSSVPVLFILEALAVLAFGVSWFVKGQTLLSPIQDQEPVTAALV